VKNPEHLVLAAGNIDLVSLEIFKSVADNGGITKAALKLNRVQSNVTTRVKQLEERLGTQLFVRQNRRLVLSAEGRVLLAYAERLLQLSAEAEAALRNGRPSGTLRIGSLESTAATRLPPVLSRFHRDFPDVRIELATGTTAGLVQRVREFSLDMAFVAEPFDGEGLATQVVFTEELVLIGPKNEARIRRPRDIGGRTIIAFATGCAYRQRLEAWLGKAGVPQRVIEFASYHAIVACVSAGSGVAIAPRSVVHALRAEDDVSVHPLPAVVSRAKTHLISRRDYQSPALDALRAVLTR
jgi:DNA-binding transcriptional LysR family regulator